MPLHSVNITQAKCGMGRVLSVKVYSLCLCPNKMATTSSTMELLTTDSPQGTNCQVFNTGAFSAISIVSSISTIISLLAVSLIPFFIVLFKQWSFFNQRLILYLASASIVTLITYFLARFDYKGYCLFSAFASQLGAWMALNAYICITATLLLKVFFTINLEKLDIPVLLFIFASPFLFNWIPFVGGGYGQAGAFCWIRSTEEVNGTCKVHLFGQVMQLVLWYIPLYLVLSVMIILYIIILIKFYFHRRKWTNLDNQGADNTRKQALRYTVSLLAYPLVYFLIHIFPFINRIHGAANYNNPSPALWYLSTILYPQQGTGVALVFFFSVRKKLNLTKMKAAFDEWTHKTEIKEYPITQDVDASGEYKKM